MLDYMNKEQFDTYFLGCDLDKIKPLVIIAPCWQPESIGIEDIFLLSDKFCKIWNCSLGGTEFTYICTGVGACCCADTIMALKESACEKLLLLGSAGALNKKINIGDFVVPQEIVCGEGASRYLQTNLSKDLFGKKFGTDKILREIIVDSLNNLKNVVVHKNNQVGFSVESIYSQFSHLNEFVTLGCTCIDLEASAFLAASSKIGVSAAICFCISDNAFNNESLIEVSEEKNSYRKAIRKKYVKKIIEAILQK